MPYQASHITHQPRSSKCSFNNLKFELHIRFSCFNIQQSHSFVLISVLYALCKQTNDVKASVPDLPYMCKKRIRFFATPDDSNEGYRTSVRWNAGAMELREHSTGQITPEQPGWHIWFSFCFDFTFYSISRCTGFVQIPWDDLARML